LPLGLRFKGTPVFRHLVAEIDRVDVDLRLGFFQLREAGGVVMDRRGTVGRGDEGISFRCGESILIREIVAGRSGEAGKGKRGESGEGAEFHRTAAAGLLNALE
jgi:hypothetical protein